MVAAVERLATGRAVTVRGDAPEGAELRWSFGGTVLADDGDAIVVAVREGEPVAGPEPWAWPAAGQLHLWRSRPYSILVTTRARRFPYWYCPIHTAATAQGDTILVTDLGLDVQLFADGRYSVGGELPDADTYPDLAALGQRAADEVVALMKRKAPPFDGKPMPHERS